ncbi:lipase [Mycolicibacterium flavescens]|uniref:Lipase n=1 Tax=Mycolicibacterium flavescens TaxID=1776 RepID=A0A1E3RH31_MYCFV|nr:lipase family protein [Mycolicibacterium flavescens]MCV7283145.1 lipase [Mycolicibacterium flavescens]ODQ89185.1 lipase [Mycolicibacterium flavescens]
MIRPVVASLCGLLTVCLLMTGCQSSEPVRSAPDAAAGMDLRPDTSGAGAQPGALYAARTLPNIDRRLKSVSSLAARIEYTSTGLRGDLTRVSATVFVPSGRQAPPGGWPVIVYGHPTTGVDTDCAPSRSPNLSGASATVEALVAGGYVVAVPDYQGLGIDDGGHPYLEPTTAGHNVIDAVRAIRRLVPEVSDRWAGVGISQGGQAMWAANELAGPYGAGLALLGTVSLAPPTDLTGLAVQAGAGALTKQQQGALQLLLYSLHREHPHFNLDDYRRGVVADKWDVLSSCEAGAVAERVAAIDAITADDLRPAGPEAQAVLEAYLRERSLPRQPASAPMLVVFGGRDEVLPEAWTRGALTAACGMGDVIDIQFQPDRGHHDLDVSMAYPWLADRFAGVPATDTCATFITPPPPAEPVVENGTEAQSTEAIGQESTVDADNTGEGQ